MSTLHEQLADTAAEYAAAGFSVVPAKADGSKAPFGRWRDYQTKRLDEHQLRTMLATGTYDGIGIVCGQVSGNLELLEFEGRAVEAGLVQQLSAQIDTQLWMTLLTGHLELTPSGGLHLLYRVDGAPIPGNLKLARRPGPTEHTVDVLIETRGEGGFTVCAPSAGRTHPTGKAWVRSAGTAATVPTITAEERDALHAAARALDAMPQEQSWTSPTCNSGSSSPSSPASGSTTSSTGGRPGDDYNARADWRDILEPHGWTRVRPDGRGWAWTRPDKNPRDGISATTGKAEDADRLYVFTSSTVFQQETPYSKLAAYALLEHGGDMSAAARELRRLGYGDQPLASLTIGAPPSTPTTSASTSTTSPATTPTPGPPANTSSTSTPPQPPPSSTDSNTAPSAPASPTTAANTSPTETTASPTSSTDQPARTSWWPRDLTGAINGTDSEPPPAHLARQDGHRLLYAGKVNGLIGESESGKSWVALHAVLQALQVGEPCLYLDFEDTAPGIVTRLRALGATDTHLAHLSYVGPDENLHAVANADLSEALTQLRPAVVVLDGVNAAMTLLGLELESNGDATKFAQLLLTPISRTGATVVTVDHVPKNADARGKGGIGAQAKRAMMTGCALRVEVVTEFGRGMTGRLKLTVDKDRPGHVRAISHDAKNAGTFVLESHADGTARAFIDPPDMRSHKEIEKEREDAKWSALMESVSRELEQANLDGGDGEVSQRKLEALVTGAREDVREAARRLVKASCSEVREGSNRTFFYRSTRPYRHRPEAIGSVFQGTS